MGFCWHSHYTPMSHRHFVLLHIFPIRVHCAKRCRTIDVHIVCRVLCLGFASFRTNKILIWGQITYMSKQRMRYATIAYSTTLRLWVGSSKEGHCSNNGQVTREKSIRQCQLIVGTILMRLCVCVGVYCLVFALSSNTLGNFALAINVLVTPNICLT